MIATVILARELPLAIHGATEFAGPQHQRVIEQTTTLEISDERGLRLIDCLRLRAQLARKISVLIPSAHVQLDETHIAFGQATRQQTIGRE